MLGDVVNNQKKMTVGYEQLTGVESSSRRRLSALQDSRIGRTRSYETESPKLMIPRIGGET
jgi:hypothetical protein